MKEFTDLKIRCNLGSINCLGFVIGTFTHESMGDTPKHLLKSLPISSYDFTKLLIGNFLKSRDLPIRLIECESDILESEDLIAFRVCTYREETEDDLLREIYRVYDYHTMRKFKGFWYQVFSSYSALSNVVYVSADERWIEKYDSKTVYLAASNTEEFQNFISSKLER